MKTSQINEPDDLPALGEEAGIFAFAMTFNGHEVFGSFDVAANSARQRKRKTIEDVRNELFMAPRASRHSNSKSYLATYEIAAVRNVQCAAVMGCVRPTAEASVS